MDLGKKSSAKNFSGRFFLWFQEISTALQGEVRFSFLAARLIPFPVRRMVFRIRCAAAVQATRRTLVLVGSALQKGSLCPHRVFSSLQCWISKFKKGGTGSSLAAQQTRSVEICHFQQPIHSEGTSMRKEFLLASLFMSVTLISPAVYASVNDDQVTSQKIKEADGTSGQNTNSGSGVKTNHIQNGAVTDAKIAGPISASKISSTGLNADTVDGVHASSFAAAASLALYQKKYGKVAVVAKSGGDYSDPVSAISDIALWCGTPSSANPCLLKIMPGIYDIGSNTISLSEFVDMEGSGEGTTTLTGSGSTIVFLFGSELRSLTIECNTAQTSKAIWLAGEFASPAKLTDLNVKISGSAIGVYSFRTNFTMKNAVITIDAGAGYGQALVLDAGDGDLDNVAIRIINATQGAQGIAAALGKVVFRNGKIDISCGTGDNCWGVQASGISINNSEIISSKIAVADNGYSGGITIAHSKIDGGTAAVLAEGASTRISFSEVVGPIWIRDPLGPSMNCFNLHDQTYNVVNCP